jgi:hypothetical protein
MEVYESLPLSANRSSFRLLELILDGDAWDPILATMSNYDYEKVPE